MAFILATDFDFIAYMSKMASLFLEAFFTPMAFLEYDIFSLIYVISPSSFCCCGMYIISRNRGFMVRFLLWTL